MTAQSLRKTSLALIASMAAMAAMAAANPAAQAQDPSAGVSVKVKFADLDLNQKDGARAMYDRVASAAGEACGGQGDLRMLDRRQLFDHCRTQTIARAVNQLHAPLVMAMAGQSTSVLLAGR